MTESGEKFQKNEIENQQKLIVVEAGNAEFLEDVLKLEKECFPKEWQYEDAEEYYKEMLEDKNNVNIFLKDKEKAIGYLLAVPFEKALDDLREYDPDIKSGMDDSKKMYLETIQVLPEFRGFGGAEKLIIKMCEEGKRKGVEKFSIHARKLNGLNEKVKKMFAGKISESRDLEKWHYGGDEPYEYIEWGF